MKRRKRIEALVAKWQRRLGLQAWRVQVQCVDGQRVAPDAFSAQVDAKLPYLYAVLQIAADAHKDELEATVAHELLHLATMPLRVLAEEAARQCGSVVMQEAIATADEQAVTRMERALFPKLDIFRGSRFNPPE